MMRDFGVFALVDSEFLKVEDTFTHTTVIQSFLPFFLGHFFDSNRDCLLLEENADRSPGVVEKLRGQARRVLPKAGGDPWKQLTFSRSDVAT